MIPMFRVRSIEEVPAEAPLVALQLGQPFYQVMVDGSDDDI